MRINLKNGALIVLATAILVAALCTAYVRWGYSPVLEASNAYGLSVIESHKGSSTIVRVSGLAGNSSCSVKKVTVQRDTASLDVLVHLMLARDGTSGNFTYDVTVPESVNEIRFGNNKTIIWKRAAS